ncbi:variant erythrocyte surface antigen-1 family protein [Babesia caballi]|uniref:Variant erythrocyte surface antigen-1 family protein n=1 Tax=Babesia caballi TaxID=5871 RepID=A0AAV4LRL9_BABCB|nr:variant erythrocyte surface antigen-1 family protein [Babesia caballi]
MATHRLCDATIAFTIGVLEGCKGKVGGGHVTRLNGVITTLHAKYGTGTQGLKDVATNVHSELNGSWGQVNQFVVDLKNAFQTNFSSGLRDDAVTVATKVCAYLKAVFNGSGNGWGGDAEQAATKLQTLVQKFKSNNAYDTSDSTFPQNIRNVEEGFDTGSVKPDYLKPILEAGKKAFLDALKMQNYTRMNYDASNTIQWNVGASDVQKCAKIFLGCLPLYYQALTYIYWGCHEKGGGWNAMTLGGGAMRSYFDSQGLLPLYVDKSKRGAHIADSALKGFSEFQQGMSEATSSSTFTYASFNEKLQKKVRENSGNVSTDCPLSALFYGASCYFRCQQRTTAKAAMNTPMTIREMLYFLAALQFSTSYGEIDGYIGTLLNQDLNVADSSETKDNNTLSADQLKEYLRASCAFSSSVLGLIQGPSASQTDTDPWLFELFCNSAFQFRYTTGATLFGTVSNYAYALQFQLIFLYSMCGNNGVKCGWQECTYGKEMNPNGSGTSSLKSHICPGFKCSNPPSCNHKSNPCNHNDYSQNNSCGKSASTPSPLQAFLTGALPSFGLSSSSTPNHMSDHPQGALCHVPMGFQASHLRRIGNGAVVYLVLKSICGNFSSPLRQLCEKLGCLTKRTPRTLGDMFGFTWHLKGQLFKQSNQGNITTANWFSDLKDKLPFSYQLKNESGENLNTFVGSIQSHSSQHNTADLKSLSNSGCKNQGNTCGPYLSPLTISNGATFGKPAPYASTYLSWMVYLTDDIETGFQELLDEFKNIDCSKKGCRGKAGSQQACISHAPGTHGTSNECKCDSVVHCGGVLPLLYRYGFTFGSTGDLFGEGTNGTNTKRTCKAFANQLQSVITGKPLQDLFESIDTFLFVFRYYFLGNLSGFWSVYVCIIVYTFFFLLDTLHLRSHLKLTSSHMVPPIGLLTSGKPIPVTKLTYIGQ